MKLWKKRLKNVGGKKVEKNLEQALAATEGTDEREDEAIIRYRLV